MTVKQATQALPSQGHPVETGDKRLVTRGRLQEISGCAKRDEEDKGGDERQS